MFFKIGFLEISQYLQENICVGVSFFKVEKKTSTHFFSCEYCKIFWYQTSGGICRSSLLNQKQCVMVSTKKGRSSHSTSYLHIISRNHFNTILLINLQKLKTCSTQTTAAKAIWSDIRILTVLRTITQEGSMETRQMIPFFYLLFLL